MLEFAEEGVLWVRTGAVVELPYRVEGRELVLPGDKVGDPPRRQTIDLRVEGVLRFWDGQRMASEWQRVGEKSQDPAGLAGEWLGKQEMAGQLLTRRMIFDGQGKCLFAMPFRSKRASYRVNGGEVRIAWPDGGQSVGPLQLRGNTLAIPGPGGSGALQYLRY
jgi:hypothetical protein